MASYAVCSFSVVQLSCLDGVCFNNIRPSLKGSLFMTTEQKNFIVGQFHVKSLRKNVNIKKAFYDEHK